MKALTSKLLMAGFLAMALSGTAAIAADFWDSTLSIQGKTLDLGAAGRTSDYAVFTTNGTLSLSGGANIDGNVGINGTSLTMSDTTNILGDVTLRKAGTVNLSGTASYTGSLFKDTAHDTLLNNGTSTAATLSSNINSLTKTTNFTASSSISSGNVILTNQSLTITATDSNPVVLKLGTFALDSGTFTLVGTAMTKYVINVTGTFNMATASNIVLSGGLLAGNVIFNFTNTSNVTVGGNSTLAGILVAANANVNLTGGSTINGQLIAKSVTMSGGSKVKKPKKPSL